MSKGLERLNRYLGMEEIEHLTEKIGEYCGEDRKRILVASGTDALIEKVIVRFFKDRKLVVLNPCFNKAASLASDIGVKIRRIQLRPPEFNIEWESMDIKNSIIIIDCPNNPTGKFLIDSEALKMLLDRGNIVIIDEAGYEYSGKTFIDLVEKYENLVVLRTFDKALGLGGMKVGYMVMGDGIMKRIDKGVEINRPAYIGALEALKDKKYIEDCVFKTIGERNSLSKELDALDFQVFESEANYMMVKTAIPDFALKLREKDILVQDLSSCWIDGFITISPGCRNDNEKLLEAIRELSLTP
jgi:histidinol-phosphate aminotransferase